jgi:hypothetical protein
VKLNFSRFTPVLAALVVLAISAPAATAQTGNVGIGLQAGYPTGLTAKFNARGPSPIDMAAAWDFGEYFIFQAHVLLVDRRFAGGDPNLRYFMGPGVFVAAPRRGTAVLGASGNFGVSYYTGPVEFYGQVTPRLSVVPGTRFDFGAALGLRFYP